MACSVVTKEDPRFWYLRSAVKEGEQVEGELSSEEGPTTASPLEQVWSYRAGPSQVGGQALLLCSNQSAAGSGLRWGVFAAHTPRED